MAHTFSITLTDEEYKAFNLIVPDADEWMENAIRNKVRKCLIYVAEEHVRSPELLDQADIDGITQLMVAEGCTLNGPRGWTDKVKHELVKKTKMKTRKERDLETLGL